MKDVRFAWVALTLAASSACGEAEIDGGARPGSWTLEAGARAALVDRRCEGEACPEYPNPHACDRLEVEVQPDGSICGVCVVGEERTLHCGGPVVGNPYACAVSVASGRACFRCTDLYGTTVLRDCGGGVEIGFDIPADGPAPPEAPPSSVPPRGDHPTPGSDETCLPASRGDGSPCEVCFDREMRVSFDSCTAEAPPSPATPTPMAPPPAAPEPPHAEPTPDAPAAPETPGSGGADGSCPEDAFESGQALFADALNELLVEAGLAPTYAPSSRARADGGADFELGGGACAAIDDDDDGGGRLLEDGELRCGYVATVAAARACTRTTSSCASIGRGILAELAASEDVLEDRYECTGSPIVLDLDGDGIRTVQSGARFDLAGTGHASRTRWIAPGDALLAYDRNGNGRIDDGRELFGDAVANDGFAALAELDDDADGDVDAFDAHWSRLRLWRDDGDGRTQPGELATLDSASIVRLSLEHVELDLRDEEGSQLRYWSRFERRDGTHGMTCDVYFPLGAR